MPHQTRFMERIRRSLGSTSLSEPPIIDLDPEIAGFLRLIGRSGQVDARAVPIETLREGARPLRLPWNRGGPTMAATEEMELEGLRCRLHHPVTAAALEPATIYLHGGGWTLLDIDTHDDLARRLAMESGRPVMLVDYPRAPESSFPLPLLRLQHFIAELRRRSAEFGLAKVYVLCGDSAGANLAVALALMLRDTGDTELRALGLIYGSYVDRYDTGSHRAFGNGTLPLSTARMGWFWDNYVPNLAERQDPLASPLHAVLAGLPPAMMTIAQYDVLYDENIAAADRLGAAGNDLSVRVYPGTVHGFIEAAGAVGATVAKRAIRDLGKFLGRHLGDAE
jgi:acetyl esterase